MDNITARPMPVRRNAKDIVPHLRRVRSVRTNSLPNAESENTAQLPATTIPRDPYIQPTDVLAMADATPIMSREPSSEFPSDISFASTAVASCEISQLEVAEEQILQDVRNIEAVNEYLERQEALNNIPEASHGNLEEENRRLREELKISTAKVQSLTERLDMQSTRCKDLVTENQRILDEAVQMVYKESQLLQAKINQLEKRLQEAEESGRKQEKFKHTVKLSLLEATHKAESGRILELNDEVEGLRREFEEYRSEMEEKLEASNALADRRQQTGERLQKKLKSILTEMGDNPSKFISERHELEKELVETRKRKETLELEAKDHESYKRIKGRELTSMIEVVDEKKKNLVSMQEVLDAHLDKIKSLEETCERYMADYQRERRWRESTEKSELNLVRAVGEMDRRVTAANNKLASQEKREEKVKKDLAEQFKVVTELQMEIAEKEKARESGPKTAWALVIVFFLLAISLLRFEYVRNSKSAS